MEMKTMPLKIFMCIVFSLFWYGLNYGATNFSVVVVDVGSTSIVGPPPNTFNKAIKSITTSASQATVTYSVHSSDVVKIAVYDLQGVLIEELLHEQQKTGIHRVVWNSNNSFGSQVRKGIYLLKIAQGSEQDSAMIIMGK